MTRAENIADYSDLCRRVLCKSESLSSADFSSLDFSDFLVFLSDNHLLFLVGNKLADGKFLSAEQLQVLKAKQAHFAAFSALLQHECQQISKTLADSRIKHVYLKGPQLAERIFGEGDLAESRDIDLLIAPANYSAACESLSSLGYEPENKTNAAFAALDCYIRHANTFIQVSNACHLDLHWKLVERFWHFGKFSAAAFADAKLAGADSNYCYQLTSVDEFIFICLQCLKEGYQDIGRMYAIYFWLTKDPAILELSKSRAAAFKLERIVVTVTGNVMNYFSSNSQLLLSESEPALIFNSHPSLPRRLFALVLRYFVPFGPDLAGSKACLMFVLKPLRTLLRSFCLLLERKFGN